MPSLALALVLVIAPGGAARGSGAPPLAPDLAGDLAAFLETLDRLRRGDEGARGPLLALSERLCAEHGRCDPRDVARYYAGLTPGERARGLADEAAFLALRDQVVDAGEEGLPEAESWPQRRERLCDELLDLATAVETRADFAPAARAYALLARLELSQVEDDAHLDGPRRAGLIARAEEHVAASVALFEGSGQVTPRLEPLWVRGRLARARGDREAALGDFLACGDLARAVGHGGFRERAILGLVDLAKDVGDVARVDRLLGELATFRDPRDSWPLAREHAIRMLHDDRPEEALAFILAHPPRAAAHRDPWRGLLAVAHLRAGDPQGAGRELALLEDGEGEFASLAEAALALGRGQAQGVIDDLGDDPRVSGWSPRGRAEAATLCGRAWLTLGRPELAAAALERALDQARSWGRTTDEAGGGGSVIGEWVGMEAVTLLARAQAQLGRGLEAAAVIEDHQSRRLRPPGARVDGAEVRGWAARFDRGLVTWSVGADSSVVVGVTAGGEAFAEAIPLGRRALLGAVRRLREAALAGDGERVRALAASVGPTLLPGAVGRHLGSGPPGGRVLFLVHGPLERLPLALLEIGAAPLDEVLTPLVLPGLPPRDDAPPPALGPGAHWRLMGSPLGLDGAPLLPGAEGELVHLARLHPRADLRVGAAFLRGALVEALAGRDPLHVATHLVPSPACGEGRLAPVGLVLSGGGVLCAEEILTLGPRLPLVVLTACETAGGRAIDGEGVHGVGRAFLEAGTRDLLVTLWPVEDGAARRFAVAFHEALGRGEPPSAAARSARRRLRAAGLTAADWAPFRLMGRD